MDQGRCAAAHDGLHVFAATGGCIYCGGARYVPLTRAGEARSIYADPGHTLDLAATRFAEQKAAASLGWANPTQLPSLLRKQPWMLDPDHSPPDGSPRSPFEPADVVNSPPMPGGILHRDGSGEELTPERVARLLGKPGAGMAPLPMELVRPWSPPLRDPIRIMHPDSTEEEVRLGTPPTDAMRAFRSEQNKVLYAANMRCAALEKERDARLAELDSELASRPAAIPLGARPHASDCAVHNASALPSGPCDCGAMVAHNPFKDFGHDPRRMGP